eukprot:tig00000981_g5863.t1
MDPVAQLQLPPKWHAETLRAYNLIVAAQKSGGEQGGGPEGGAPRLRELARLVDAYVDSGAVAGAVPWPSAPLEEPLSLSLAEAHLTARGLHGPAAVADFAAFVSRVLCIESQLAAELRDSAARWSRAVRALDARDLAMFAMRLLPDPAARWLAHRLSGAGGGAAGAHSKYLSGSTPGPALGGARRRPAVDASSECLEALLRVALLVKRLHELLEARPGSAPAPHVQARLVIAELVASRATPAGADAAAYGRAWANVLVASGGLDALVRTLLESPEASLSAGDREGVHGTLRAVLDQRLDEATERHEMATRVAVRRFLEFEDVAEGPYPLPAAATRVTFPGRGVPPAAAPPAPPLPKEEEEGGDGTGPRRGYTATDWVRFLLARPERDPYERADALDRLVHWDQLRLLTSVERDPPAPEEAGYWGDGGELPQQPNVRYPPAPRASPLSHGGVIALVVSRLRIGSTHHSEHEPRTPVRCHLLKFLFLLLLGSGERGRIKFREAGGLSAAAELIRGRAGPRRYRLPRQLAEEELDFVFEGACTPSFFPSGLNGAQATTGGAGRGSRGPRRSTTTRTTRTPGRGAVYGEKDRERAVELLARLAGIEGMEGGSRGRPLAGWSWGARALQEEAAAAGPAAAGALFEALVAYASSLAWSMRQAAEVYGMSGIEGVQIGRERTLRSVAGLVSILLGAEGGEEGDAAARDLVQALSGAAAECAAGAGPPVPVDGLPAALLSLGYLSGSAPLATGLLGGAAPGPVAPGHPTGRAALLVLFGRLHLAVDSWLRSSFRDPKEENDGAGPGPAARKGARELTAAVLRGALARHAPASTQELEGAAAAAYVAALRLRAREGTLLVRRGPTRGPAAARATRTGSPRAAGVAGLDAAGGARVHAVPQLEESPGPAPLREPPSAPSPASAPAAASRAAGATP